MLGACAAASRSPSPTSPPWPRRGRPTSTPCWRSSGGRASTSPPARSTRCCARWRGGGLIGPGHLRPGRPARLAAAQRPLRDRRREAHLRPPAARGALRRARRRLLRVGGAALGAAAQLVPPRRTARRCCWRRWPAPAPDGPARLLHPDHRRRRAGGAAPRPDAGHPARPGWWPPGWRPARRRPSRPRCPACSPRGGSRRGSTRSPTTTRSASRRARPEGQLDLL